MMDAFGRHLWQSTIFAIAAGLLTLAFRGNRAQVRYWLWLSASFKFFVPFVLLIDLGHYLDTRAPSVRQFAASLPAISYTIRQVEPPASHENVQPTSQRPGRFKSSSGVLASAWLCGFAAIALIRFRSWRRVRKAVRASNLVSIPVPVEVRIFPGLLEPGVVGFLRPVLLLPRGIQERLSSSELQAVLTHELCHVQRRDNLFACLHMLVETVFWFHPLVWWIGARLIEERERACDEAVLQLGNEAEVYAESILNVCKFYGRSPMACISGVTGSGLKRRIVRIMAGKTGRKLDISRKLLLGLAAAMAIALPLTFGLFHPAQVRAQSPSANPAGNITATWQGTLHTNQDVRFVVKVTKAGDGTLRATFYNIDGPPGGIPALSTTLNGSLLKFDLPFGAYEGALSADGNSIRGTWRQGPNPLPLNFVRATPATEWTIPQPPPRMPPMAANADPTFEVASIKLSGPDEHGPRFEFQRRRFSVIHTSASNLAQFAFGLQQRQIAKMPDWAATENYDISAEHNGEGEPSIKQWQSMVRKLMADRFQLKFHYEKREFAVYVLTVARTGPRMTKSQSAPDTPPGLGFGPPGNFGATNATMADVAEAMGQAVLDRPVVDQTGLEGKFDLRLRWTPDETQFGAVGGYKRPATENPDAPPELFTAIQEELGLKLVSTKAPVDVLVIDSIERPSAN